MAASSNRVDAPILSLSQWCGDGREILYRTPDNRLMAVAIKLDSSGRAADVGIPVELFSFGVIGGWTALQTGSVSSSAPTTDSNASAITVVLNWRPPVR
jgi:hypothetical protein